MRPSAPDDFPAFGALLFGRARAKVPTQTLQAESIADLRQSFGLLIPDACWQRQAPASPIRQRLFSPLITFWAFLSQVLAADSACRTAVRKVQAWWARQGGSAPVG